MKYDLEEEEEEEGSYHFDVSRRHSACFNSLIRVPAL